MQQGESGIEVNVVTPHGYAIHFVGTADARNRGLILDELRHKGALPIECTHVNVTGLVQNGRRIAAFGGIRIPVLTG